MKDRRSGGPARQRAHILVLGNAARSLVNFRGPLIREMLGRGHRVTAASGEPDRSAAATLAQWGAAYEAVPLGRTGLNPFADLATFLALVRLMRRVRPDVLFAHTIKPVVYGLLAARAAGVPRRVAMITGLGYAFGDGQEAKRRLARSMGALGYRSALRLAERVIFQNPDDRVLFVQRGLVSARKAVEVAGSGVDLAHYAPAPLPDGPVTFLMVARLLADKGVREFAAAARIVRQAHPQARFVLVGPPDPNPAAIGVEELEAWQREGAISWAGALDDVRPALAACHVFVLPSYYREGLPRSILEAMATGRAIITTDAPGCRETVVAGQNGLLVPPRDAPALAEAMLRLAADRAFVAAAGQASLALARETFDVAKVNAEILEVVENAAR